MTEDALIIQDGVIQGVMERPKSLDPNDLSGTEDITIDEIRLPRLCIAQGLSPQLVPTEGTYIKGLVIGQMFNDVSETIYGNGPISIIPLIRSVSRIEFDPLNKGVPKDRFVPAGDGRLEWRKNALGPGKDGPPLATEYVEFVSLILQPGKRPEPIVVSIKTTNKFQRRAAELWTTYIGTRSSAIYTGLYTITSKIETGKNKDGQNTMFGVFIVKNAGYIPTDSAPGQALKEFAQKTYESFKGKKIETSRESEDADTMDPPSESTRGNAAAAAVDSDIPF